MAKYLCQGSYTEQGLKGLLKEGGSKRQATVEQLAKEMGGTLEAFYFAFGSDDFALTQEGMHDVVERIRLTALCKLGAKE